MDENEKTISRALLLDVESEYSREFVIEQAKQAKQENWYYIYLLSQLVSREVSILVDSNDNYWVDWGTIGSVELSPPVGAVLPFKLWVHTHPSNTAYWSITDRNSLEIAKGILEKAMVLGEMAHSQPCFNRLNHWILTRLIQICSGQNKRLFLGRAFMSESIQEYTTRSNYRSLHYKTSINNVLTSIGQAKFCA